MINKINALAKQIDWLSPLTLRLFLAPVFIMAGLSKHNAGMENIANYFAYLEIPFPLLSAYLATYTELLGGIFLLAGFMVRFISLPLLFTMLVAAYTAHWDKGWGAIAEGNPDNLFATEKTVEASKRLNGLMDWLKAEHPGRHQYVTEHGRPVILNNGIEFAITYAVMCLALFVLGAGRFFSVDYYLCKRSACSG